MKHLALPKRLLLMIVVAGVVLAIAPCVFADSDYTENISLIGQTTQACTPACTGPFATMSVDLTSTTTAVITLTGDSNGTYRVTTASPLEWLLPVASGASVSIPIKDGRLGTSDSTAMHQP
jgi:hypothetical protein